MYLFNKFSIRKKVIAIILTVTLLSLFLGFLFEIVSNIRTSKTELINNISLDAKLISDYAVPTLLFDDKTEAAIILKKLENIPSVLYGEILDKNNILFSRYNKPGSLSLTATGNIDSTSIIHKRLIEVSSSVNSSGEKIGTVHLIASTDIIKVKTLNHIKIISLIFLISSIIAIFLSILIERIITHPILALANVARTVRSTGNLSLRINKISEDETGLLYDSFNDLLISLEAEKKERDLAEEALLEERENLERRVDERTIELKAAKEKAEESDKLKSSFLANMSHEIRTPLNIILGFSNLLVDPSVTPEERQYYCKMMDASGQDLIKLIDDILDISRIEANLVKISPEEFSVNSIVKEVFDTFRQTLIQEVPESVVKPLLRIPDRDLDYIMNTDRLRVKQILLNILNNAIKFTPTGSIEFGYLVNESEKRITFFIKDSGIGIPFVKLEKIFDRFMKVADVKTKHYKGTGLGLSISLKLAKMIDGDIKVESEENKGSVFYVSLPYISESQTIKQEVVIKSELKNSIAGKLVLIVEDVDWNYQYLRILLNNHAGCKTLWAKDGSEAVDICRKHPDIDIVLMDIQLPVMNGYDATRLIKSFNPGLPIVAQSGYAMSDERAKSFAAGCSDFIAKPVLKNELFYSLSKVLLSSSK
jgi:signal transduction histidine kinase/ActR/RegA family two-component response regulator